MKAGIRTKYRQGAAKSRAMPTEKNSSLRKKEEKLASTCFACHCRDSSCKIVTYDVQNYVLASTGEEAKRNGRMGRRLLTQGCEHGGSPRMGQQTLTPGGGDGTAQLSSKRLKPDASKSSGISFRRWGRRSKKRRREREGG